MGRRTCMGLMIGLVLALAVPSHAFAQRNLSRKDRLLFFYYGYYSNQQNAQRILRNQRDFRGEFGRFRETQRRSARVIDPIERLVRQGRPTQAEGRRLPAIYGGEGRRRSYFMNVRHFNPSTGF